MRTKPPDGERLELPFLDITDVPEFDEDITGLDDVDDLLREVASLPGPDDLVASTPSIAADRATLIGLDDAEQAVSRMLGMYATRKPPRRCHRPRRRRAKP